MYVVRVLEGLGFSDCIVVYEGIRESRDLARCV